MSLIQIPPQGMRIVPNLATPDNPIIPFIEGDGVGVDITPVMIKVINAAVDKAYGGGRNIHWMEIYCGQKAQAHYGIALPQETLDAMRSFSVAIKGPLSDASLDRELRLQLDLYASLRPVRNLKGMPSTLKAPDLINMAIFRDNTASAAAEADPQIESSHKIIEFMQNEIGVRPIRIQSQTLADRSTQAQNERLLRKAIQYAIDHHRKSVTLVHKSSHRHAAENRFCVWGYALAKQEFGGTEINGGPFLQLPNGIVIKDAVTDAFLQQVMLRPTEYDVIAAEATNGDYLSDSLAIELGGMGIAPSAQFADNLACFEATHGTAPAYAGLNKVNPGSLILSAEMMLRHIGWKEAADLVILGIEGALCKQIATCDLARLMDDATEVSCSAFGQAVIDHM